MAEAFPRERGRSQVVVAIARPDRPMTGDDIQVAYDVARRLRNLYAAARLAEARRLATPPSDFAGRGNEGQRTGKEERKEEGQARTFPRLTWPSSRRKRRCRRPSSWIRSWRSIGTSTVAAEPAAEPFRPPRLALIYHNLAVLETLRGDAAKAEQYRAHAADLRRRCEMPVIKCSRSARNNSPWSTIGLGATTSSGTS